MTLDRRQGAALQAIAEFICPAQGPPDGDAEGNDGYQSPSASPARRALRVGQPLTDFHGVLTGVPRFVGKASDLTTGKASDGE